VTPREYSLVLHAKYARATKIANRANNLQRFRGDLGRVDGLVDRVPVSVVIGIQREGRKSLRGWRLGYH
jgi:hypothetical protein